jgi:hypothetical protein
MKTKRTLCNNIRSLCNHNVVSHSTEPVPGAEMDFLKNYELEFRISDDGAE